MAKLQTKKAADWIKNGAPAQALDFLGAAVDTLHNVAVEKQIVFKEKENEMENVVVADAQVETPVAVVEEKNEEVEVAVVTETPVAVTPVAEQPNVMEVLQKGISQAIVVALKEYNDAVVAPLQASLAELNAKIQAQPTTLKNYAYADNVFAGASDFMPSAAVAAMIQKEFGSTSTGQVGDVVAPQIEEVKTAVTEKQVTTKNYDASNVFADF
jgi:hypothetical protein